VLVLVVVSVLVDSLLVVSLLVVLLDSSSVEHGLELLLDVVLVSVDVVLESVEVVLESVDVVLVSVDACWLRPGGPVWVWLRSPQPQPGRVPGSPFPLLAIANPAPAPVTPNRLRTVKTEIILDLTKAYLLCWCSGEGPRPLLPSGRIRVSLRA
jgi:hypothetical protein